MAEIKSRIDTRLYFRRHCIPSKKSFKSMILVEDKQDFLRLIASIGKYTDIRIDSYPPDKRRGYTREGVVSWMDNMAVTAIDSEGQRQNIGYISNASLVL